MFVCGFSIVRCGVEFTYPFLESIQSLLPLVDKFIINVGVCDDSTVDLINGLQSQKIKMILREWDMSMREGGKLLSYETNKALEECEGDWAFYLQADEVLHEEEYDEIYETLKKFLKRKKIEGISFKYYHFEGTYDFINPFRYRREIRVIRPGKDIVSWGDAASFRHRDGSRLRVGLSDAHIYHYGWVRSPKEMLKRKKEFEKLYHDDKYIEKKYGGLSEFPYFELDLVRRFKGTHPAVMKDKIEKLDWGITLPPHKPLFLNPKVYKIILKKWGLLKKI